jgi:hypothetical protein
MKRSILAALALALAVSGCADQSDDERSPSQNEADDQVVMGSLSLALTATDSKGGQYRLRNANFALSNPFRIWDGGSPEVKTLSSETDPASPTIRTRLEAGEYMLDLQPGWHIEKQTDKGPVKVDKAVLLTQSSQFLQIVPGWEEEVEYRFGVDGSLIDFRSGALVIRPVIELPGETGGQDPCANLDPYGYGAGIDPGLGFGPIGLLPGLGIPTKDGGIELSYPPVQGAGGNCIKFRPLADAGVPPPQPIAL